MDLYGSRINDNLPIPTKAEGNDIVNKPSESDVFRKLQIYIRKERRRLTREKYKLINKKW